jgi:hypothetical protein
VFNAYGNGATKPVTDCLTITLASKKDDGRIIVDPSITLFY